MNSRKREVLLANAETMCLTRAFFFPVYDYLTEMRLTLVSQRTYSQPLIQVSLVHHFHSSISQGPDEYFHLSLSPQWLISFENTLTRAQCVVFIVLLAEGGMRDYYVSLLWGKGKSKCLYFVRPIILGFRLNVVADEADLK